MMRNRAKCRKCQSIIESYHDSDYVSCKCGEISIDGGNKYLKTYALDYVNFLRVDDQGNEIVVKMADAPETGDDGSKEPIKPNKDDLLRMLDTMAQNIEQLPQAAMLSPINHYDFASLILLLSSILRCDCAKDKAVINELNCDKVS